MRVDDDGICNNFPLDSWLLSRVEALTSRFERHKCHFSRATGNLARQNCPAKNFQWLLILTRSPKNVLEQFGTNTVSNSRLSERTRMGSHGLLLWVLLAFSSPSLSLSCSERQLDTAQMGFRFVLKSSNTYTHIPMYSYPDILISSWSWWWDSGTAWRRRRGGCWTWRRRRSGTSRARSATGSRSVVVKIDFLLLSFWQIWIIKIALEIFLTLVAFASLGPPGDAFDILTCALVKHGRQACYMGRCQDWREATGENKQNCHKVLPKQFLTLLCKEQKENKHDIDDTIKTVTVNKLTVCRVLRTSSCVVGLTCVLGLFKRWSFGLGQ